MSILNMFKYSYRVYDVYRIFYYCLSTLIFSVQYHDLANINIYTSVLG